ncbi:MAG TPA: hypothetical protein VI997_05740 [Candidatus Thermoplasmatota archaeon]|nr:hypothetical protein [Candidatus Thermoplasmatota archaeon]
MARRLAAALALVSVIAVVGVTVPPVQADGPCQPGWAADQFPSGGLFVYDVAGDTDGARLPIGDPDFDLLRITGGHADAARLDGPTLVCREKLGATPAGAAALQQCRMTGAATHPPIQTELVALQLHGTSFDGRSIGVSNTPGARSPGQVGPIRLACDRFTGTMSFASDAPSFFDVFFDVETELGGFRGRGPAHVVNDICGLPPAPGSPKTPEGLEPCLKTEDYRHAGGGIPMDPTSLLGSAAGTPPATIHADAACHAAFFGGVVPPDADCTGYGPGDGTKSRSRTTLFWAGVGTTPVDSVRTKSVTYFVDSFFDVFVDIEWAPGGGGVHAAELRALAKPGSCPASAPCVVTVVAEGMRGGSVVEKTFSIPHVLE